MNNEGYHDRELQTGILAVGLDRRTQMVIKLARDVPAHKRARVLDIGTADGAMLTTLKESGLCTMALGIEASFPLCYAATRRGRQVACGDGRHLPFPHHSFDVVVLSATLKHVKEYGVVLSECRRVLQPGGHLIVLDPTPFGIRCGLLAGHFERRYLHNTWTIRDLSHILHQHSFAVIRTETYMLSPVRFYGDRAIERVLRYTPFCRMFLQQGVLAHAASL